MTMSERSPKRRYTSPRRQAARARTRAAIVSATEAVLRDIGWPALSLEAVAKEAGVTRLTVYNHFGSRRALLEAVFDAGAEAGGLHDMARAMALEDPHAALARTVAVFCGFWQHGGTFLGGIMAEAMRDPEFADAIAARNARRRRLLTRLVARLADRGEVGREQAERLVGTLFALTSFAFFSELRSAGIASDAISETIADLVAAAVARHGLSPSGTDH